MATTFVSQRVSGRPELHANIASGSFTVHIPNGLELDFSALDFMSADHYGVESDNDAIMRKDEWLQAIDKFHRDINFQRLHYHLFNCVDNNRYLFIDEVADTQYSDSTTKFKVSKINSDDVKVANGHLRLISNALKCVVISSPSKQSHINLDCDQLRYETDYGDFIFQDHTIEGIMKEISDILNTNYHSTIEAIHNLPDPIVQDVPKYIDDVCNIIDEIIKTNEANADQVMHIYEKYVFNVISAQWVDD